jgi:hypothetical protein
MGRIVRQTVRRVDKIILQSWRHGRRVWGGKLDGPWRSDLRFRAISGFETSDRLKGNSGLFASSFLLINLDSTSFRMSHFLYLSDSSKADIKYSLPPSIRLLYLLNHGSTKEVSFVGLDQYGQPPTCH